MHECVELQFVFFFLLFFVIKRLFVAADKCVKMLQTHTPFMLEHAVLTLQRCTVDTGRKKEA